MAKIKYNGKEYEEPNAAWSQDAPAMYRETPEALEQRWTFGYGGKGYKDALENYDNLSPLEQDILNNVTAKGQAAEAAAGLSGGYGGNYGGNGGYKDSYAGQIKSLTDKLTNLGPFSYDYNADPLYQQYAKEYTRLGQRAMDDTLAKISARTGGLASSYAASAGNQAYGNYMQQLSNKIPELYKLAYDMYNDDYNRNMNNLNLLRGLSGDEYSRFANERSYADSRADLDYNRRLAAANQDYERSLAAANLQAKYGDMTGYENLYGLNGLQDRYNDANAVFAYGDDGSTYDIGSPKGQYFIANAQPGQTMTGGDGSTWTKEADGSVTITRGGQTWRIVAPATGRGGGGDGVKTPADLIDYDSDRGKSLVSASQNNPALAQQYLATYWDSMGYTERFSLLQNMGYDNQTAMSLAREGGLSGKDFNAYISANAPAADTLMETINSEIKNQKDAVNYLQDNGIMAQPLSQEQWAMTSGNSVFKTYSDYLKSFVYEYMGG